MCTPVSDVYHLPTLSQSVFFVSDVRWTHTALLKLENLIPLVAQPGALDFSSLRAHPHSDGQTQHLPFKSNEATAL